MLYSSVYIYLIKNVIHTDFIKSLVKNEMVKGCAKRTLEKKDKNKNKDMGMYYFTDNGKLFWECDRPRQLI